MSKEDFTFSDILVLRDALSVSVKFNSDLASSLDSDDLIYSGAHSVFLNRAKEQKELLSRLFNE